MQQPINGRLLVQVDASGEYKHVTLNSDQQHKIAVSVGKVLAVASDLDTILEKNYPNGSPYKASDFVGAKVRWEKFAEQNTLQDVDDPNNKGTKIKVALIEFKDLVSYEK